MTDEKVKEAVERLTADAFSTSQLGRCVVTSRDHLKVILSDRAELARGVEQLIACLDVRQDAFTEGYNKGKATSEAKLTALVEALGEIGRRARCDGQRTFDDTMRDLGWIDDHCRLALAHHSAPVGEPVLTGWPKTTKPKQDVREFVASLSAPPTTPISAPVEDVGGLVDVLEAFYSRKYVQRADDRQKAMGLRYTTAETHDLAKETAKFLTALIQPQGKERP